MSVTRVCFIHTIHEVVSKRGQRGKCGQNAFFICMKLSKNNCFLALALKSSIKQSTDELIFKIKSFLKKRV